MNGNGKIPFLDLVSQHRELEQDLVGVFRQALQTAGFIGGPMVEKFEEEFSRYCGTRYCIGVGSGTDALRFALVAAGVKPGEIVITVPNSFIATTEAISQAGATIAFVDIDERTYNMDPAQLRQYLDTRCRIGDDGRPVHVATGQTVAAVIPVHLYGQTADMQAITAVAQERRLKVIEDGCQAHGAQFYSATDKNWKTAGSLGHAAAFSFYPGKNLGACGEAGAVTTDDASLAAMVRMLRDHGQARKYYHDVEGYNGRLDAIQAGILSVKLKHLPAWTEARRAAAMRYNALLYGMPGVDAPFEDERSRAVYHLYVVRTKDRDGLKQHLADRNIDTGLHYPLPLHLQKAYANVAIDHNGLAVAEQAAREILSLPMFPGLTDRQQLQVVEGIWEFTRNRESGPHHADRRSDRAA